MITKYYDTNIIKYWGYNSPFRTFYKLLGGPGMVLVGMTTGERIDTNPAVIYSWKAYKWHENRWNSSVSSSRCCESSDWKNKDRGRIKTINMKST